MLISNEKKLERQVIRIISRTKDIRPARLRQQAGLSEALGFDVVDVVDIILALENSFHIHIPDEVPFHTVGDFVTYVVLHSQNEAALRMGGSQRIIRHFMSG